MTIYYPRRGDDVAAALWDRLPRRPKGKCWPFMGRRHKEGYGVVPAGKGKALVASRVAYELTYGPIPAGLLVLHRCDNPPCCNPDHLFLGTHQDNANDKMAKRRHAAFRRHSCPHGHTYDEHNTYVRKDGARSCRKCQAERMAAKRRTKNGL